MNWIGHPKVLLQSYLEHCMYQDMLGKSQTTLKFEKNMVLIRIDAFLTYILGHRPNS